ncbi:MAG: hypothetical protein WC330_04385 [Candidatus Omnitrophota bacterium]|jgi:hypothetical protein
MAIFRFFNRFFNRHKKKKNKKAFHRPIRKKTRKSKPKVKLVRRAGKKTKKKPLRKAGRKLKRNKQLKKKKASRRVKARVAIKEKEIGKITHYFDKIAVGIIKLKGPLAISEHIHIKGKNTDFTQVISSMQYNHKDITLAERGLEIGIKVNEPTHENDVVYKVI